MSKINFISKNGFTILKSIPFSNTQIDTFRSVKKELEDKHPEKVINYELDLENDVVDYFVEGKPIFDFYFSQKHREFQQQNYLLHYNETKVNGIPYTEMIKHGRKPITSHFGDLELVFSGDEYSIT